MFNSRSLLEDDRLDARVVEDALAFIDAFYNSTGDPSVSGSVEASSAETEAKDNSLESLCGALDGLYIKLAAIHRHGTEGTTDQVRQLVDGDRKRQINSAIQQRLGVCRRLWLQVLQFPCRWLAPLQDSAVSGLLLRRIEEITTLVVCGASERPLLEQHRLSFEDVSSKYFDHAHNGAAVRFRSGRFIPFKLSVLAKTLWSVVVDGTFSAPGHSLAAAFEHRDEILAHFQDDLNEAQGVVGLRRSHLPDGSILICWSSVSAAPHATHYDPQNIVEDMEFQHMGWVRVGHLLQDTCRSPRVYLEGVTDLIVRPRCGACHGQQLNRHRFERFKAYMLTVAKADSVNRQILENRMLDATRGTSCYHGSPH